MFGFIFELFIDALQVFFVIPSNILIYFRLVSVHIIEQSTNNHVSKDGP